jgi:hypothetical protein
MKTVASLLQTCFSVLVYGLLVQVRYRWFRLLDVT